MSKPVAVCRRALLAAGMLASAALVGWPAGAADLTETEARWLKGAWPVVVFARDAGLPLDIVVQPQPTPGVAPLALAYVDGRCKLVLSMRGNPEAPATLRRIAPPLLDAALELMAAHELGHCRRYVDGAWYGLPAGFSGRLADASSTRSRAADANADADADADRSAARREEGYGDLVGLAWTQWRHPALYRPLQAWLVQQRADDSGRGSPHDTLAWLRLAEDGSGFANASIFASSAALWAAGLAAEQARQDGPPGPAAP